MPAAVTQGIGVLSSISFAGTKLASAFQKGLGNPRTYINVQDNLGLYLQRNNPLQAITALETARQYELGYQGYLYFAPIYVRGVAYLNAHQGAEAAAEFDKFNKYPGIAKNSPFGALALLQMARAQAMAGDTKAAHKSYQDFLALWNNADADIPLLKEAHSEYEKLR